jgi:hypothetical protein
MPPFEMNAFSPSTTKPPSTASARVAMAATSEPDSGSERAKAAIFSPPATAGR